MAIDLGPFQELTAINFKQGGIFGRIGSAFASQNDQQRYHNKSFYPSSACSTMALITASNGYTPTATGRAYTFISLNIFVGEDWKNHPLNPFAPELSESPGTIATGFDNLADSTLTHVPTAESFKISDEPNGPIKLCEGATTPSFHAATWATSTNGTNHTAADFVVVTVEKQYWQYSTNPLTIGTAAELWGATFFANDASNSPPVSPLAKFWSTGALNDKITWT